MPANIAAAAAATATTTTDIMCLRKLYRLHFKITSTNM